MIRVPQEEKGCIYLREGLICLKWIIYLTTSQDMAFIHRTDTLKDIYQLRVLNATS